MTVFSTRQWIYACLFALFLHIGLFVTFVHEEASEATAKEVGLQGIDISLGPAGGIPAPATEETNETSVDEEATETEEIEEPEPEKVEEPIVEHVEPEAISEEAPEEVKKEAEVVIKKVPKVVKKVTAKSQLVKKAKPVKKVKQVPSKSSSSGTMAVSGTKDKQDRDDGDASSGGGIKGTTTNYMALLQSWLEKHKKYPRRARRRGHEGVVLLYFKMDRQGNVLSYTIKQSSGYSQLDDEVEAMIKRAQPLPPFPKEMGKEVLELIVPVQFQIR
ncbi:MAG: hypothetical protein COB23_06860 [Methylophaga sp.]|nr:MAG: hypothetical protein COB23_06860 [Methylophaga sp.]